MKKFVLLGDTLLNDEPLGIQRFAYEILRKLDQMKRNYEIELLIPKDVKCKFNLQTIPIVKYGNYKIPFVWRQFYFTEYAKKNDCIPVDLTLGLTLKNCGVVALFDCIYENYPEDFIGVKANIKRLSYLLRTRYVTKKAKKVITISKFSKEELKKKYKWLNNVDILYCGWQHYERIRSNTEILNKLSLKPKKYLFSLGSSLPHKNFEWIVRAAVQNPEYIFVVTGTNKLSQYQSHLDTEKIKNIIFTGFLKDNEVKGLMENCQAFLHPAKYEGFGIPPLEALSCGAKVISSNATCLPEIFGNSVVYFDPESSIINIAKLLSSKPKKAKKVLEKYNWEKSAHIFNEILEKV